MITFYRPGTKEAREQLGSVVWNPQANAPLADFTLAGGKFDTDDPKVIAKLRELGYPEVPGGMELEPEKKKSNWVKTSEVGKDQGKPRKPVLKARGKKAPGASDGMDSNVSPR